MNKKQNIAEKAGFTENPTTANYFERHREIRRHRGKSEPKKQKKKGRSMFSPDALAGAVAVLPGEPKRGGAGRGGHA